MTTHSEAQSPVPVSLLGLGPMGQALAAALLAAGHPLTVWNRTPGRAPGLAALRAPSPAEAVRAAPLVLTSLTDPRAVRAVLADVPAAAWEGRTLVNLSSGTPHEARALATWAGERGIRLLGGAVLTPTPTIGTPAGALLLSGPAEVFEAVRAPLGALGGRATYVGAEPGRAAAYEVALLAVFAASVQGLAHGFAFAAAEGIAPEGFGALAGGVGAMLPEMAERFGHQLRTGTFPGERSTLASAASALSHLVAHATTHGIDTGLLSAARRL
ncbi:NAD(P)-binding domain-containing protein, partial [Streptomyces sp. SID11385]|uniref:NAD(P)-dependent oxidoreductase n=1 Tax=Streptomyces sp. SID11385 TaxID=2706031 RepID=UPI0013C90F37